MRRRIGLWESVAVAAVLAAAPLAAQSTNQATGAPTPTPTPTPAPPTGNSVGPPQLRDFNLGGNVAQPAPPPAATPTPAPTPTPRDQPAGTTTPRADAPATAAPRPSVSSPRAPAVAAPDSNPATDAVTVDLPPLTPAPITPAPLEPVAGDAAAPASSASPAGGLGWWPWLAALLALALAGGLLWWRRQQRDLVPADHAELGAAFSAPEVAPPLPRAPAAPPRPAATRPAPAPVPVPAAAPTPSPGFVTSSIPAPAPTPSPGFITSSIPAPAPAPVPTPAPPPMADGIFSSRLRPELEFELVPIRAETDVAEGAALTFDLILINRGSAPARDVLVELQLLNAGPQVDAEVGRFFQQPAGTGERVPLIPPMGRVPVRACVSTDGASMTPLVVEGRKLLVPVVAVNASYRWSGGDLRDSSSFLIGRGDGEGGKMAPFRLDLGARSWSTLGVRLHSSGLENAPRA